MDLFQHILKQIIDLYDKNLPPKIEQPTCIECGARGLPRHHLVPQLVQLLILKLFGFDFFRKFS